MSSILRYNSEWIAIARRTIPLIFKKYTQLKLLMHIHNMNSNMKNLSLPSIQCIPRQSKFFLCKNQKYVADSHNPIHLLVQHLNFDMKNSQYP